MPTCATIKSVWGEDRGEDWERFRDRHGDWGRDAALYLGRRQCALSLPQLGKAAGGMDYAAVSVAIKRFEKRLAEDRQLRNTIKRLREVLKVETWPQCARRFGNERDAMITVGAFSKPEEANLLRSRLEAAGIPAFVRDELTIQMYWLYSNALGGVRVVVPDEHAEVAREIIALPPVAVATPRVCPRCSSDQAIRLQWPKRLAYLSLLVAFFPLLLTRKRFKCKACGHRWR